MSRLFGIAGIQMSVVPWDPKATVTKMIDTISQVSWSFPWVEMIIFHELAIPGFVQFVSAKSPDLWRKNAEPIPGPSTDQLCKVAKQTKKWVIPGSMHEREGSKIYNTAVVISPEGEIVTKYRKMFPWLPYESTTTPGEDFLVFDIPGAGRFGLAICYDLWFPEFARTLAWMGAEVIIQPTMTPTSDRNLELVMMQANAIFNQAFLISINGVGPYGGGRSIIVDPDGRILQKANDHETILTEIINLDHVTRTRELGTIGLGQTLKQLRDSKQVFPVYKNGIVEGGSFAELGPLAFHRNLQAIFKEK
jgi:formamidase